MSVLADKFQNNNPRNNQYELRTEDEGESKAAETN
jgi:hypothetical protein